MTAAREDIESEEDGKSKASTHRADRARTRHASDAHDTRHALQGRAVFSVVHIQLDHDGVQRLRVAVVHEPHLGHEVLACAHARQGRGRVREGSLRALCLLVKAPPGEGATPNQTQHSFELRVKETNATFQC